MGGGEGESPGFNERQFVSRQGGRKEGGVAVRGK